MAGESRKLSELPLVNTAPANASLVFVANAGSNTANTQRILLSNLFGNSGGVAFHVNTPANSNSITCKRGQIFEDGSYIYIATANNVVKRVALSSF